MLVFVQIFLLTATFLCVVSQWCITVTVLGSRPYIYLETNSSNLRSEVSRKSSRPCNLLVVILFNIFYFYCPVVQPEVLQNRSRLRAMSGRWYCVCDCLAWSQGWQSWSELSQEGQGWLLLWRHHGAREREMCCVVFTQHLYLGH